uniref:PFU domain-containing protein n=1 Tax=Macrostomum lignano TaxID=282301 RepID=A0A1I8F6B8_9PLAT
LKAAVAKAKPGQSKHQAIPDRSTHGIGQHVPTLQIELQPSRPRERLRVARARVWSPDLAAEDGAVGYTECLGLCSHAGYVNAVAWMDPCDWCPGGLLYTAWNGQGGVIFAFTLDSPEPVASSRRSRSERLRPELRRPARIQRPPAAQRQLGPNARLWRRNRCVAVFAGRPRGGGLVRYQLRPGGGAGRHGRGGQTDQAVADGARHGYKDGETELRDDSLSGHFDAVRGLCRLPNRRFVSCSNDATLRLWHLHAASSQMTFEGHAGFVYAVAALPDPDADGDVLHFASASEDRTCRLWSVETGACLQALTMPCQSIWAVCWLVNGDLAVAGSDAVGSQAVITSRSCIVCLFTSHSPPARPFARSPPTGRLTCCAVYEAEVADSAIPVKIRRSGHGEAARPGGLDQGRSAGGPGYHGEARRQIEAHQWSNEEAKWQKVGDVVGGEGGETVNSGGGGGGGSGGRTRFEGQDYDFVFTVDVEEGKPPLKLPYNRTEDPWFAAQRFIDKHLLPQAYLDQVAQFIRTNAGETPTISQGTYADPYTGSGRYIPGSGTSDGGTGRGFSDPFTGGNRYVAWRRWGLQLQILSAGNMAGLRKKLGELAASVPADLPDRLDALVESGISQGDSADARLILWWQQQAECPESSADRLLELLHRMLAKAGLALKDEPAFLVVVPGSAVRANDLGLKPLLHRFTDTSYSVRLTEAATV